LRKKSSKTMDKVADFLYNGKVISCMSYSETMQTDKHNTVTVVGSIPICSFSHPRANFGPKWTGSNEENAFAQAFATTYNRKFPWFHSGATRLNRRMAHEVPVNGLGIADLVSISWSQDSDSFDGELPGDLTHLTLRAFEVKLSDWKRGLMQAHRYTYFADVSILVMPASKSGVVLSRLHIFKTLGVGFWSFNPVTHAINAHFTPRPRRSASTKHREMAISAVCNAAMPSPPIL